MVLRESLFVDLLAYLRESTTLLSPDDIVNHQKSNTRPKVLLTFDDGWLDNLTVAQPHMASIGARACFFVPTRLTGQRQPFWPEKLVGLIQEAKRKGCLDRLQRNTYSLTPAIQTPRPNFNAESNDVEAYLTFFKQLPPNTQDEAINTLITSLQLHRDHAAEGPDPMEQIMTWNQIRFMVQAGHKIGSHGCTHAILPLLPLSQSRMELVNSMSDLDDQIPQTRGSAPWLSYPNGSASAFLTCAARAQGYQYAFTNTAGRWSSSSPAHMVPRINVWDGTLTDENGHFSKEHLEYSLYWKTRHANQ
jgi:peptidoglycan/xylan/chitin deacetylase (PgdA/CDA1 family)